MNESYGKDFFLTQIERQYGKRFARDYDALHEEVEKVRVESKYHIDAVLQQSEVELGNLRKIIDERQQEINRLHEKWVEEIDKARVEVQFTMETEF
jgi:hypothetical protein